MPSWPRFFGGFVTEEAARVAMEFLPIPSDMNGEIIILGFAVRPGDASFEDATILRCQFGHPSDDPTAMKEIEVWWQAGCSTDLQGKWWFACDREHFLMAILLDRPLKPEDCALLTETLLPALREETRSRYMQRSQVVR